MKDRWSQLSMSEKSDLMSLYIKNGISSLEEIKKHYNSFATGGSMSPDHDPNHPYHYHNAEGEKIVITPEDWEANVGKPYFKEIEDAVRAEQVAYPEPEYEVNPDFVRDLRSTYRSNMGNGYQNYRNFSSYLPQGYTFSSEGMIVDPQGNYYVQSGYRQSPRFTYSTDNPLNVNLSSINKNLTFYPINMDKRVKAPLPVDRVMDVDEERKNAIKGYIKNNTTPKQRINYINSVWVSYLHPELATSDEKKDHYRGIRDARKLGYNHIIDNFEPGQFNGWLIGFTDKDLNKFKQDLWNKASYEYNGKKYISVDGYDYDETLFFNPNWYINTANSIGGPVNWSDGPKGNQGFQTRYEGGAPSEKEAEKKAVISIGPLEKVNTFATGGHLYQDGVPDEPNFVGGATSVNPNYQVWEDLAEKYTIEDNKPSWQQGLTDYDWARARQYYSDADGNLTNQGIEFLKNVSSKRTTGQSNFMRDVNKLSYIPNAAMLGAGALSGAAFNPYLWSAIGLASGAQNIEDKNYKEAALDLGLTLGIPAARPVAKMINTAVESTKFGKAARTAAEINKAINKTKFTNKEPYLNVGWAPKQDINVYHASNEPLTIENLRFPDYNNWAVSKGAPADIIYLAEGDKPVSGFLTQRPYLQQWEVSLNKPMVQVGEIPTETKNLTRGKLLKQAQSQGADAMIFDGIADNQMKNQRIVADFTKENLNNRASSIRLNKEYVPTLDQAVQEAKNARIERPKMTKLALNHDDRFTEGVFLRNALDGTEIAPTVDAHGISKGNELETLENILTNGFDKSKTLYTAPLAKSKELEGIGFDLGTASTTSYTDGMFILTSKPNGKLSSDGIDAVLINTADRDYALQLQKYLKSKYPKIKFLLYDEAPAYYKGDTKLFAKARKAAKQAEESYLQKLQQHDNNEYFIQGSTGEELPPPPEEVNIVF